MLDKDDEKTRLTTLLYDYRIACLQGEFPDMRTRNVRGRLFKGFLLTSPIMNRVAGEEHKQALRTAFTELLSEQPLDNLKDNLAIEIRPDGTCSARSIIFGALITASVAIKNETKDPERAAAMRNTLTILLERAQELKQLYEDGNQLLVAQSGEFPKSCNTVIALINSILHNQISTTEVIFQANKDADMLLTPTSSLNQALADLSNYMLYQEARKIDLGVVYIREGAENVAELLKRGVSYSTAERSLVCQHLQIGSQSIAIMCYENDPTRYQRMQLVNESIITNVDEPDIHNELPPDISFTTVTACGHTNFILDAPILDQYLTELADDQERLAREQPSQFNDPEIKLHRGGIRYHKKNEPAADILLISRQATNRLNRLGEAGIALAEEMSLLAAGTGSIWRSWQGSKEKLEAIALAVNRMPTSITTSFELIDELKKQDSSLSKAINLRLGLGGFAQPDANQLALIQQKTVVESASRTNRN